MADKAWSRAFTRAARRFYGERNFDDAIDGHTRNDRAREASESPAEASPPRLDEGPGYAP